MKMHEYQNKGVTKKACRKLLKIKKRTNGCSGGVGNYGIERLFETTHKIPRKRVAQELMEVKDNFWKKFLRQCWGREENLVSEAI